MELLEIKTTLVQMFELLSQTVMNFSLLIAPAEDCTMSATEAALDTLEESEEKSKEESPEAASAHAKSESRLRLALPHANATDNGSEGNNLITAHAEGSDKATGELRSSIARKAPQPKSNEQERTASTRFDHTQSPQPGRSNTGLFAQRERDEVRSKLSAVKRENSLLHEKVGLIDEKKSEVTDHWNLVREQKESLEATLYEKEEEYKQLLKKFEVAKSEVRQYAIDQKSQERESLRLLEQIKDLTDENKRLLN